MFICVYSFFLFQHSVMSDSPPLNHFLWRRDQQNSVNTVKLKAELTADTLGKRLAEGINPQLHFIIPQTEENRHPGNFYSLKHLRIKAGNAREPPDTTDDRKEVIQCALLSHDPGKDRFTKSTQVSLKFSLETRK